MISDTDKLIESLKNCDKEGAKAQTEGITKKSFCCGKERTPKAIISFPDENYEYFICPKCESY